MKYKGGGVFEEEEKASSSSKAVSSSSKLPVKDPCARVIPSRELADSTYETLKGRHDWLRKSRSENLLTGAPPLVEERTRWIIEDRLHHPYNAGDHPDNKPKPLPKRNPVPPPIWYPTRGRQTKAEPLGSTVSLDDTRHKRVPWDAEHHIKPSKANSEVQVGCREYFDRPLQKENDGVPKVLEVYQFNDRIGVWDDRPVPRVTREPADRYAAKGFRRTIFTQIGPFNLGGCKDQQMVSYWRKNVGKQDAYSLSPSKTPRQHAPDESLCARLAVWNAPEAADYWREWSDCSKQRLPPAKKEKDKKSKPEKKSYR